MSCFTAEGDGIASSLRRSMVAIDARECLSLARHAYVTEINVYADSQHDSWCLIEVNKYDDLFEKHAAPQRRRLMLMHVFANYL